MVTPHFSRAPLGVAGHGGVGPVGPVEGVGGVDWIVVDGSPDELESRWGSGRRGGEDKDAAAPPQGVGWQGRSPRDVDHAAAGGNMADASSRGKPTAKKLAGRGEGICNHRSSVVSEHEAAKLVDAARGEGALGVDDEAALVEGKIFDGGAGAFHVAFRVGVCGFEGVR